MPNVEVNVTAEVEFSVGEKTAAWLESLGWQRPAVVDSDESGTPCGHNEAGSLCDWDVCFQPEVECSSTYAHEGEVRKCKREQEHRGIHSDGTRGFQWPTGDPYEVAPAAKVQSAEWGEAQTLYYQLGSMVPSGELNRLLRLMGVDMDKFLAGHA